MEYSTKKNRIELRAKLLQGRLASTKRCFVGFDGFTDEIAAVVLTRFDARHYTPMTQIAQLGEHILAAANKSCNVEWIVKETKLGGNAPILTNALLEGGHEIVFAGAIGSPQNIEAIFAEMAARCVKVYPLAASGLSRALEFRDGKVIFGSHASVMEIDSQRIFSEIGFDRLVHILQEVDLFVSANWTMLPGMTAFWERVVREILPRLHRKKRGFLFVDLADPAKRSDPDLRRALQALSGFQGAFETILGLNHAEALRIARVLDIQHERVDAQLAEQIYRASGLSQIVIHAPRFALVASKEGIATVDAPYCEQPLLTTGAGDNFNAGYCNALLYGLSLEDALLSGVFTSGYYVRKGCSPSMQELADFLIRE